MHTTHIYMPRVPHYSTLTHIHSRPSSFAYSTKLTRTISPLSQPLVLCRLQITAGLCQTYHHSPAAAYRVDIFIESSLQEIIGRKYFALINLS